ncbi:MAG TPA: TMEM175 family protein [Solirubrobacteraceae bacterium]|jgi:uncharacterized membrane protein
MSSVPDERAAPQRWETGRVEAFSDGVFAIAITLLVLEITVEPSDFDHLRSALLHEWPSYLAYVTSFLTVGSVWIAHHNLFSRLRYVDAYLLRLNLLLLMAAAFLPFPTGVLAQAIDASRDAERTAIVFYGATALVIELLLRTAVRYAFSRPELTTLDPSAVRPPRPAEAHGWRSALGTALYSVAIIVGIFTFPRIATVGYFLIALRGVIVIGGEGRLGLRRIHPHQ